MNKLRRFKWVWAVVACLATASAQASIIQSMTIEEIGIVSGGFATSSLSPGGGRFSFLAACLLALAAREARTAQS